MTKHQLALKAYKERQKQLTEVSHALMAAIDKGNVCHVAVAKGDPHNASDTDHWNLGPNAFFCGIRRKPENFHIVGWCCTCFAMTVLREIANEPKPRK